MGNPQALADAILRLKRDCLLRQCIGKEGRKVFQDECRPKILGSYLARLIQETLNRKELEGH
jgi:hypothetical protein